MSEFDGRILEKKVAVVWIFNKKISFSGFILDMNLDIQYVVGINARKWGLTEIKHVISAAAFDTCNKFRWEKLACE